MLPNVRRACCCDLSPPSFVGNEASAALIFPHLWLASILDCRGPAQGARDDGSLRLSPSPCAGCLGSNNPLCGGSMDVCYTVPGIASRRVSVVYCGEEPGPSLTEHGLPLLHRLELRGEQSSPADAKRRRAELARPSATISCTCSLTTFRPYVRFRQPAAWARCTM